MKKKLIPLIILFFIINPLISIFALGQRANSTADGALSKGDAFASLCSLINLSVNASMAHTFPINQSDPKKTKQPKQDQENKLYCASTPSDIFPVWRACFDTISTAFDKCKTMGLGLDKFYPEKWRNRLIFLLLLSMLYLLPRGAIDDIAMPKYKLCRF